MPKISDYRQSNYLTQKDVATPIKVTISSFKEHEFLNPGGTPQKKAILLFRENIKPLVLNIVNMQRIEAMTGSEEFQDWIGTTVVLYIDPNVTDNKGKLVGGIRIRAPRNQAPVSAPVPAPVPEPEPDWDSPASDDDIPSGSDIPF